MTKPRSHAPFLRLSFVRLALHPKSLRLKKHEWWEIDLHQNFLRHLRSACQKILTDQVE